MALRTTKLMWYGRKVSDAYMLQMFKGVEGAGRYLEEYIKHSFDTSKSGSQYAKPGSGHKTKAGGIARTKYTASAVGETPAIVTGKLRASITHKTIPWKLKTTVSKVGVIGTKASEQVVDPETGRSRNITYGAVGAILELGLGSLKGPHPFLRPALDKNRMVIFNIIIKGMRGGEIASNMTGLGFWKADVGVR